MPRAIRAASACGITRISFETETDYLLHRYVPTERRRRDAERRVSIDDLRDQDPLFLSRRGHQLSDSGFRIHCKRLRLRRSARSGLPPFAFRDSAVEDLGRAVIEPPGALSGQDSGLSTKSRLAALDHFEDSDQFSDREKVALRYADAIPWDPSAADDAMWAELKRHFSEPELVELGYLIASSRVASGGSTRCGVQHGDVAAESTTGYRPKVVRPRP